MAHSTEDHSDMKLFKNRLWKLMNEQGLKTAQALADKLCEGNYIQVEKYENTESEFDPNRHAKIKGAIRKQVNNHLNLDTVDKLPMKYLQAYCDFFHCSSDYLLGKIDCVTHNGQFIKEHTGLSEDSIRALEIMTMLDSRVNDTVNILLGRGLMDQDYDHDNTLLMRINHYLYSHTIPTEITYVDYYQHRHPMPITQKTFDGIMLDEIKNSLCSIKKSLIE